MNFSRRLLFVLFLGFLASCTGSLQEERSQPNSRVMPAETNRPPVAAKSAPPPTALDTTNFSPRFLQNLKQLMDREKYTVRGQWLIVGAHDSVAFPTDLPKNQPVVYSGATGSRTFRLTVTRRNFTTIRYAAEVLKNGRRLALRSGTADLNPSFYTGTQVPIDSQTQAAYGAAEFVSDTNVFSVLLGTGSDADKAEVYTGTGGRTLPLWQNAPTLHRN